MSLTETDVQVFGEIFSEKYAVTDAALPEPRVVSNYFWDKSSLSAKEIVETETYLAHHPSVRKSYEAMIERSKQRRENAIRHKSV